MRKGKTKLIVVMLIILALGFIIGCIMGINYFFLNGFIRRNGMVMTWVFERYQ